MGQLRLLLLLQQLDSAHLSHSLNCINHLNNPRVQQYHTPMVKSSTGHFQFGWSYDNVVLSRDAGSANVLHGHCRSILR